MKLALRSSSRILPFVLPWIVLGCSSSSDGGAADADPGGADSGVPNAAPGAEAGGSGPVANGPVPDVPGAETDAGPRAESGAEGPKLGKSVPSPVPTGCLDAVNAGDHVYTCEGLKFDVTVPKACESNACGLVVDVHGLTMNGAMEERNTGLRSLAATYGVVVMQPSANGAPPLSSWDLGGADDVKVWNTMKLAMNAWHVDVDRVHFTGFSQGGGMTWRFLCKHADALASVAPAAMTLYEGQASMACTFTGTDVPSREVDVLYMMGTKDTLATDMTGAKPLPIQDAVVAHWKLPPLAVIASGDGFRRRRTTSAKGTVFEHLEHDWVAPKVELDLLVKKITLGGHCYPGSTDTKTDKAALLPGQLFPFGCEGTMPFSWGEEVMKFFAAHPRKP
ncbi:MAG: hypothetical protein U0169_24545 [Polyangiaceae bacterium]